MNERRECPECRGTRSWTTIHYERAILAAALLAFVLTLLCAPWEQTTYWNGEVGRKDKTFHLLFGEPSQDSMSASTTYRFTLLKVELMIWWFAIAVGATGGILIIRTFARK